MVVIINPIMYVNSYNILINFNNGGVIVFLDLILMGEYYDFKNQTEGKTYNMP